MHGRNTYKTLGTSSGTQISLPGWVKGWQLKSIKKHKSTFSELEGIILDAVADTILPESEDGLGATSVGVGKFLRKLFDQCYDTDVTQNIKDQLRSIDQKSEMKNNISFAECDYIERKRILNCFSHSDAEKEKLFFDLIKAETIRGFRTSKKVMKQYGFSRSKKFRKSADLKKT